MYDASLTLADFDLQLAKAIQNEKRRQEDQWNSSPPKTTPARW